MSSTSEDDWEKDNVVEIKINLDNLKLSTDAGLDGDDKEKSPIPSSSSSSSSSSLLSKPAVIMPSYLDSIDDGDFNFNRHDTDRILDDKIPVIDEPIHTALLTAAANPKERMFVLTLEDNFLNFVKSDDIEMEYPGTMNSFRRLLIYQSTYRFHLSHTILNNDTNDSGVILIYKTSETKGCIPKQLLIDLENPSSTDAELGSPSISDDNDNKITAPKKVLMMKRNPSNNDIKKDNIKTKQENNSADKERAYAEARARIFGNLGENADSSIINDAPTDVNASKGNSISRSTTASPALSNAKVSTDSLKSQDEVGIDRVNSSSNISDNDQIKSQGQKGKKPSDLNAWKGNKAIEKNQFSERADPDFMRMRDANPVAGGQAYYEMQPEAYSEQQYYYQNNNAYNNAYPVPPQAGWTSQPMYPPQYQQYYQQQQYPSQQQYQSQQQFPPTQTQQYATRQQYGESPRNYRQNGPS